MGFAITIPLKNFVIQNTKSSDVSFREYRFLLLFQCLNT